MISILDVPGLDGGLVYGGFNAGNEFTHFIESALQFCSCLRGLVHHLSHLHHLLSPVPDDTLDDSKSIVEDARIGEGVHVQ